MPYKIRSPSLSTPWFEKIVANTLDMYLRGEELSNSPLTKIGRRFAGKNRWHPDFFGLRNEEDIEDQLRVREKALVDLYHSIKKDGYNGSIIAAWFDRDGQIHLYDGFHRLAVMKYLGIEALVNVETVWWGKDFDFPLRDTLIALPRVGECTYQPVNDERVKDLPVDRQDSPTRLEYILSNLVGSTVLDIGCSEGYFSRELAKRGYKVTAIDTNRDMAAVTRYLSIINNVDVECHTGEGEEFLKRSNGFDNVLYLSVFHNNITNLGLAKAIMLLRKLRCKAKRLFFEVPDGLNEWQWKDRSAGSPLFHFKNREFEQLIETATGMRVYEFRSGFRPMYLLKESKKPRPLFRPVSEEEWDKHSRWELDWWQDCINTYSEQVLQEMYAEWMKLNQFATGVRYTFDLKGISVIDIGGGPVSLLLRCKNFSKAVVVDPVPWPKWVVDRYEMAGIRLIKEQGENITFNKEFDEAWIYNCLQHVRDPEKVVKNAITAARKIRVFEPLEIGVHPGHPHNLSKDALDQAFEREGIIFDRGGNPGQVCYCGVFNYG
jgi:SAM-dependent methyltransferase